MSSPRSWRHYPQRYRYEAAVCTKCGKVHFPPRLICDACKGREFTTKTMARTGKILTHTIVRVGPSNFADQSPFAVAVVEMDDGPRITCQVADWNQGQLTIGQKVRLEFRKIYDEGASGIINYGYKAVPI